MNKAQATVRMDTVQMQSMLETQVRMAAQAMLVVALRAEDDAAHDADRCLGGRFCTCMEEHRPRAPRTCSGAL